MGVEPRQVEQVGDEASPGAPPRPRSRRATAARRPSGTTPSDSAAAWPRMAVSGVRRSCVTRIRNSRVSPSRSARSAHHQVEVGRQLVELLGPRRPQLGAQVAARPPGAVAACIARQRPGDAAGEQQREQQGHAEADAGGDQHARRRRPARPTPSSPGGRASRIAPDGLAAERDGRGRGLRRSAASGAAVKSMRCTPVALQHARSRARRRPPRGSPPVGLLARPGVSVRGRV